MTLFDPSPYVDPEMNAKQRKRSEPATGTQRESDGTWFAISRRSGMAPFSHRLGQLSNKYGSIETRCGMVGRIVEAIEKGTVTTACDRCFTLGALSHIPTADER